MMIEDGTLFETAELFGHEILVTDGLRLLDNDKKAIREKYPNLYFYGIRHDDDGIGEWVQIKDYILVNHLSDIISKEPIETPQNIEYEDWGYTGEYMTIEQYVNS